MATTTKQKESIFAVLNAINVNGHVEKKKTGTTELSYLSWAWAWAEVKKHYPDATYTIYRDERNLPYIEDPDYGLMCYTTVTIEGQTLEMWLPVMDGANKAMRRTPYTYKVWDYRENRFKDKAVAAATMFDINKTIMRCLVKNLAMFGLGLYIYAGEDLPEPEVEASAGAIEDAFQVILPEITTAPSREHLKRIYNDNTALHGYQPFMDAMAKRKKEVA